MIARFRGSVAFALVVAVAAVIVSVGSATAPSGTAARPTLYFMYAMNCTFTIVDDTGKSVTTIPPGNYQVEVRTPLAFGTVPLVGNASTDMTACKGMPQFQLTGPGINLSTTMTAGCQSDLTFPETFQPNATYTAVDNNQPSVAHATLTTLASGAPANPNVVLGATTSHAESSSSLLGSNVIPFRGTLTATLSATGIPSLTMKGKPISTLPAGRYTFAITDQDPNETLALVGPRQAKTSLTRAHFVGKSSTSITLVAGRWTYVAGPGEAHSFVVTK